MADDEIVAATTQLLNAVTSGDYATYATLSDSTLTVRTLGCTT